MDSKDLEDGRAPGKGMGQQVDLGLLPGNKAPVDPYLRLILHMNLLILLVGRYERCT
jgi:hypothetical protein